VLTASVGAGHNQVARALMASLGDLEGIETQCADVLDFVPAAFRKLYAGGYVLGVTKLPWMYAACYHLSNRPHCEKRGLSERARLFMERRMLGRLGRHIDQFRPDLIVNTHFLASPYVGRLIAHGRPLRQTVVVTDIEMHRWWYAENVERWFAPCEYTAWRLSGWSVPSDHIVVSGIPVHPKWDEPVDHQAVIEQWRLPADKRIVLLASGAEFTCGPIVRVARGIAAACAEACVVVLGGRNKKLLARLASLPESPQRIVGMSFTDRVNELVSVASVMVTKAGGVTTAECLNTHTPMVLMKPIGGQEAGNARYLAGNDAAVIARHHRDIPDKVAVILSDAAHGERLAQGTRALARPGRQTVVNEIARMLNLPKNTT